MVIANNKDTDQIRHRLLIKLSSRIFSALQEKMSAFF